MLINTINQTLYGLQNQSKEIEASDIEDNLYIVDKKDNLVQYIPNAMQADLASNLTGRDLVLKYRQGGASTFMVIEKFVKAVTERSRIGIMAHDSDTTQKLRRMAQTLWENLPDDIQPDRGLDNARTTSYKNTGSEITIATAGSANVGRGGTYGGGFLGDEVAFWRDTQKTMSAMINGVPDGAPITLVSTPNGAQGWFYNECLLALADKSDWTLHFYAWWWDVDYKIDLLPNETIIYDNEEAALVAKHSLTPEQIKWRRKKQRELHEEFIQEYPEDPVSCFLTSGGGVFTITQDMLYTPTETEPIDGHVYCAGIDWGMEEDYTVVSIFDATDYREVALFATRRRDDDAILDDVADLLIHWGVSLVYPEYNSIGGQYVRRLSSLLAKYYEDKETYCKVSPFNMGFRSKDRIIKSLKHGLFDGLKLIDDDDANHEMRAFKVLSQSDLGRYKYGAPNGSHDDKVIARLLAHEASYRLKVY